MSHEITSTDRFAENRREGKRAWHFLGDPLEEGDDCQTGFRKNGISWGTTLAPIQALVAGGILNVPGRFAHVRDDIEGPDSILGIVSDGYKPFENMDLAKLADSIAGEDKAVTVETCGTLYGGRRVFALVKLPHEIRVGKGGEDVSQTYVLCANGHGGFAATACYPTSIRVVCANTLAMSEIDVVRGVRFRHQGDLDQKVATARLVLGTAVAEAKKFGTKVMRLANLRLTDKETEAYLNNAFDAIFGSIESLDETALAKREEKRKELLEIWKANLQDEKQKIAGIEGTAWAAYNAISQYEDHERGRFKSIGESPARVASNIFGVSHTEKNKAFRAALALT